MKKTLIISLAFLIIGAVHFAWARNLILTIPVPGSVSQATYQECGEGYYQLIGSDGLPIMDSNGDAICMPD